jgi:BMFP domain-containing protein YqiC
MQARVESRSTLPPTPYNGGGIASMGLSGHRPAHLGIDVEYTGRAQTPSAEEHPMLDPKQLDDLAQRLASAMPKGIQMLQEDIGRNLRATLESGLGKLDLVTREEFDVQSAVLARSREKLTLLEARIAELERALATPTTRAG